MKLRQNPFTTLYVTERMENDQFPPLFSPILVPQALPLFQAGNVVVNGTPGTGKSMLLALLRTDIRIAFEQNQQHGYPVTGELRQFISAGINLATNQALRFANRWGASDSQADQLALRGGFVDYVNAWLLRDLLGSIDRLLKSNIWNGHSLGERDANIDSAVQLVARDGDVGLLPGHPRALSDATRQLTDRINSYLRFLNGKIRDLPEVSRNQGSPSFGDPIAAAVRVLRTRGFLNESTRVLVTIDQFEQLLDFEAQLKGRPFGLLRQTISEAIHRREPTLCYRIGTRPYAWRVRQGERLRDYFELGLDGLLSRKEHSRNPLFPALAEDVFKRRLRCFGYSEIADESDPLKSVFGVSPSPAKRAKRITSPDKWTRLVRVPMAFPTDVQKTLCTLASHDPLSAKLGVAWVHQQLAANQLQARRSDSPVRIDGFPWEGKAKHWWKKERLGLGVLQLAAGFGQRVQMFGKKDVLDLSGSNVLVFGSICQHIWACWIRSATDETSGDEESFPVDEVLQDEGSRNASWEWHRKISEEPWLGDSLTRFIDAMGNYLHASLVADKAMSYPGGNGISLSRKDLRDYPEVEQILMDGTDRGFLLQRRHTPKNRSRGPSIKWYLHPVLSPHFEITVGHTKEPRYVRARKVHGWMEHARIVSPNPVPPAPTPDGRQKHLPGFEEE